MAGGGLMTRHLPVRRAHGVDAFHFGTSVRHGASDTPIDPAAVRRWRQLIETDPGRPDPKDL
jgi:copper homeostasis protein